MTTDQLLHDTPESFAISKREAVLVFEQMFDIVTIHRVQVFVADALL